MKLFQQYEVKMEVTDWNDRSFQMLHTFVVDNRIVAEGTSMGILVSKTGVVPPVEVIKIVTDRLNKQNT